MITDEEREIKAGLQTPGMYFVVTNPKSFECLPEYRDNNISDIEPMEATLHPTYWKVGEGEASTSTTRVDEDSKDTNTIILRSFEDPARRGSIQLDNKHSMPDRPYFIAIRKPMLPSRDHRQELGDPSMSRLDVARAGGRDSELLEHYRTAISHHLAERIEGEDVFEAQARKYPSVSSLAVLELRILIRNSSFTP